MSAFEGKSKLSSAVPVLSLVAYASGDQMGGAMKLTAAMDDSGDTGANLSLVLIDAAKQKADMNVYFFSSLPTIVSVDNAALNIAASEMVSKCLGFVRIAAADYEDLSAVSVATIRQLGLLLKADAGGNDIYVVLQAKAAPTYAAANNLTLKIGILQD